MSLMPQFIQLLSEAPGSILYHLMTLFAVQVVFALALTQWRRSRQDRLARRTTLAAGSILLMRLAALLAGLVVTNDPTTAVAVLPPLEQAINSATAVLLIWALLPIPSKHAQLADTIVILLLLLTGIMYIFFAQAWPAQALAGTPYFTTTQATIWSLLQLALLITGLGLTVGQRASWLSLPQLILTLLLLTHLLHFFSNPQAAPNQSDIGYWIRAGYLAALPLWAIMAYRHSLVNLLPNQAQPTAVATQMPALLDLSTQVIRTLQPEESVSAAIQMATRLLPAPYTAIALARPGAPQQMDVVSNQAAGANSRRDNWAIYLAEWPAFQQALEEGTPIELKPTGLGARQLRLWAEEMGLTLWGALLILPLIAEEKKLGLLLLGLADNQPEWPEAAKELGIALARYIAQVLHNGQVFVQFADQIAETPGAAATPTAEAEPQMISGRLIALEQERDHLQTELSSTTARLLQAETQAAKASRQAQDLAATLEELEKVSYDERIASLEKEIETLQESLIEAEEAMALAAAGEGGLSTEWILTTITRYSGQLEAAQARIQTLQADLMRRERGVTDELVVSLAQELRTPMTSIAGYTDLLLSEMIGALGAKQRDFLQRVKANVERMDAFLDLIVQLTTAGESSAHQPEETADIQAVVDTAVATVITQIREKRLRLDLDISPQLPPLAISRDALQKIISNLLSNACRASRADGRVAVRAYTNKLPTTPDNGHAPTIRFMHLAVTDSGGGIPANDQAKVFDPQHRADHPLIPGLGDTGAGLAVARTLTEAHGGRVWIESEMGSGSTFSVLFPLANGGSDSKANGRAG